jgi:Flp pilus assembly protein TadD
LPRDVRRLAGAWFALALSALGMSALLAIVLVAARSPFLGLGGSFFRTALVLHVNLGVVVWFLAAAAGAWTLLRARADRVGWGALALAVLGLSAMIAAPVLGGPPPVLANYVPVLDSPVFLGGLAGFLLSVVGAGMLSVTGGWSMPASGHRQAARWAVLTMAVATAVFAIDQGRAGSSRLILPVTLDDQLWGTGHLLQFVHDLLMMSAWMLLGRRLLEAVPGLARRVPWLLALTALATLGGLFVSLHEDIGSFDHRQGYTSLMRWATWPGPLVLGAGLAAGAWRLRRTPGGLAAGEAGLLASMALYAFGCLIGAAIQRQGTTSVPAHYHGTVGAVTLAYLTLAVRHAGSFGVVALKQATAGRLTLAYGLGIAILVTGLAWSGALGVPRKAPHAELMQADPAYLVAMSLAGLGGFLALAAVLALVCMLFRGLRRPARAAAAGARPGDVRMRALAITASAVFAGGLAVEFMPAVPAIGAMKADGHVAEKKRAEIDLRFSQGVAMLHFREYDHALTAFHRVIELAPQMPEAYVNAGFALLGLGRHEAARDFFDEATTLRKDQINGYYGLALALEGTGDAFGAMQAMEVFLHRAPADDPYRRKAEAAVWEWRARLDEQKASASATAEEKPAAAR